MRCNSLTKRKLKPYPRELRNALKSLIIDHSIFSGSGTLIFLCGSLVVGFETTIEKSGVAEISVIDGLDATVHEHMQLIHIQERHRDLRGSPIEGYVHGKRWQVYHYKGDARGGILHMRFLS